MIVLIILIIVYAHIFGIMAIHDIIDYLKKK